MSLLSPVQSPGSSKRRGVSRCEGFIFAGLEDGGRGHQPDRQVPRKLEKARGQTELYSVKTSTSALRDHIRSLRAEPGLPPVRLFPSTSGFSRKVFGTPRTLWSRDAISFLFFPFICIHVAKYLSSPTPSLWPLCSALSVSFVSCHQAAWTVTVDQGLWRLASGAPQQLLVVWSSINVRISIEISAGISTESLTWCGEI